MPVIRVDKTKNRHRLQRAQDIAKAIAERDAQQKPAPAVNAVVTPAAGPVESTPTPDAATDVARKDTSK